MGSIYQSIEILSKEKGIDPQIVLDAVKDAMLIAARKHFRSNEDYVADFNETSGAIELYAVKTAVETVQDPVKEISLEDAQRIDPSAAPGAQVRIAKSTDVLGRISAQTAKQVIFQKVREAERETIYQEYSGRVGELVNCTIKRIEGLDLIVDLGKTEARLPKKEQSRLESFSAGERVRCVIKLVDKSSKGPGVLVSRAAPELVMRLFEQEVPEIYDSTVVIKGCAREAGERTKIAVQSRDRDVDSVGACVGMKGMRVQSIIRELRGEKIDIIEYSEDPVVFATHALSPAKISRVTVLDPVEKHMEVIVDDSQLSLAIGKKGQNVRLAAKLLGWRIDIKSEEEKRQEVESAMAALVAPGAPLSVLVDYGMSDKLIERLLEAGVATVEKLGSMTPEELEEIQGIGPKMVERIQIAVNNYFNQLEGIPPVSEALAEGESLAQSAAETAAEPALEDAGAAGFETSIITPGEEEWAAEQPAETELSVEEEQPAEVTAQPVADTEPSMAEDAEQLVESTAEPLMDEEALSPDGEEFPGSPPEDQEQASETYGAEPEAAKPVAENSDSTSLESDRMNDKGSGSHDREQENDEEGG